MRKKIKETKSTFCDLDTYPISWSPCILYIVFSLLFHIYSIDVLLYPYALPIVSSSILFSSLCLSSNLSLA